MAVQIADFNPSFRDLGNAIPGRAHGSRGITDAGIFAQATVLQAHERERQGTPLGRWGAKRTWAVALGSGTLFLTGYLLAAAGAGAGGPIYYTERGAESIVPVSVDRAASVTRNALDELKVRLRPSSGKTVSSARSTGLPGRTT